MCSTVLEFFSCHGYGCISALSISLLRIWKTSGLSLPRVRYIPALVVTSFCSTYSRQGLRPTRQSILLRAKAGIKYDASPSLMKACSILTGYNRVCAYRRDDISHPQGSISFRDRHVYECTPSDSLAACADDGETLNTAWAQWWWAFLSLSVCYAFHNILPRQVLQAARYSREGDFDRAGIRGGAIRSWQPPCIRIPIEFALEKTVEDTRTIYIKTIRDKPEKHESFEHGIWRFPFPSGYGAPERLPLGPHTHHHEIRQRNPWARQQICGSDHADNRDIPAYHALYTGKITTYFPPQSLYEISGIVLVPAISGVVIAISDLIIRMLSGLSTTFASIARISLGCGRHEPCFDHRHQAVHAAELLQIVVGYTLSRYLFCLRYCDKDWDWRRRDKQADNIWKFVIIGLTSYVIILLIIMMIFAPLIDIAAMKGTVWFHQISRL